jgi:hypothetical protein
VIKLCSSRRRSTPARTDQATSIGQAAIPDVEADVEGRRLRRRVRNLVSPIARPIARAVVK